VFNPAPPGPKRTGVKALTSSFAARARPAIPPRPPIVADAADRINTPQGHCGGRHTSRKFYGPRLATAFIEQSRNLMTIPACTKEVGYETPGHLRRNGFGLRQSVAGFTCQRARLAGKKRRSYRCSGTIDVSANAGERCAKRPWLNRVQAILWPHLYKRRNQAFLNDLPVGNLTPVRGPRDCFPTVKRVHDHLPG